MPGETEGCVRFGEAARTGANIARLGEDVRAGDEVEYCVRES